MYDGSMNRADKDTTLGQFPSSPADTAGFRAIYQWPPRLPGNPHLPPALLVSLAHSDFGPLHATRLWRQTQPKSFPQFVRINLGVEKKQHIYETWRLANA